MPQDTTYTRNEEDTTLAILHIGMLLATWDADNTMLPISLPDVNQRILEVFGIEMWNEPDVQTARSKIIAIIENVRDGETQH